MEVKAYASCTLLAASMGSEQLGQGGEQPKVDCSHGAIEACMDWLIVNEFIHNQKEGDGEETYISANIIHSLRGYVNTA